MSFSLKNVCCNSSSSLADLQTQNWDRRFQIPIHRVSNSVILLKHKCNFSRIRRKFNLFPLLGGHTTAFGLSDAQNYPVENEGSMESKDSQQERSFSTTKILEQLKRYGASGVLSYGLLNTAYYLTTFLLVWFFISPTPGKMGYLAAVSRFLKVMAMVWAGSQVTKLIRAAGVQLGINAVL